MKPSALLLAILASTASAQEAKKQDSPAFHPGVDQKRVNLAIQKGIAYLKTADSPGNFMSAHCDELILLTFVHAGVPEDAPRFKELFAKMMAAPLERTYNVALQAMVLEELQRVRYQGRLHQCGQFLADNQCANGQWSYGTTTTLTEAVPGPPPPREVATGTVRKRPRGVIDFEEPEPGPKAKPRVQTYLSVEKKRDGGSAGDNSNSQYAALGLRACHDGGIVFPKELVALARKYWVESQHKSAEKNAVATGGAGVPRGWCYHEESEGPAYGSMSAGAVGALCIYDAILGTDWKKDKPVLDGLGWLAKNFSVVENVGKGKWFHYYYLYALERVGMLYDTPRIGTHDWYREGASQLLQEQRADGSWGSDDRLDKPTWGTCFAILFLKQATRRLVDVASVDRYRRDK
jgi:hypothetical protein